MGIPINPTSIAGSGVYVTPLAATPVNLCKPPADGVKCVPMQFIFSTNPSWQVDFSKGSPTPPLSQLSAVYVDATLSSHDISIYFPDTGYRVRVPFGSSQLFPVITGKQYPLFYVILENNNATDPTDMCNVFALNQFVPEFSASAFAHNIAYGYGALFGLFPTFSRTNNFCRTINHALDANAVATLITASQWYIVGVDIEVLIIPTADGATGFTLFDNGVPIWIKNFIYTGTTTETLQLINLSGLNYVSSGAGNLTCQFIGSMAKISSYQLSSNIFGGILIP